LHGIDLAILAGEVVCIVGPNGAGKTTLLRTLSGLCRPSAGTLRFKGEPIGGLEPHQIAARGLGHCPEGRRIFQQLTVEENLVAAFLPGRGHRQADLFDEVYALFPILPARRHQPASRLSGGEQQMLAIGRALMGSPDLLLLDEPSLGLAPLVINQIFEIVIRLAERGVSILLVEQNVELSFEIADYVYALEHGQIRTFSAGRGERGDDPAMTIERVAVVGGGIIGSSWAIVYARAGLPVALSERSQAGRERLAGRLRDMLRQASALVGDEQTQEAAAARIAIHAELGAAVGEADFVHECIEEKLDAKVAMFGELDRLAKPAAILASTTSSFPASRFASDLPGRARCIVVHPATPPHLLPVTEICPAPFTDPKVTDAVFALMERCGQVPVLIRAELPSFVLNRMQAALFVEMFRCLDEGVISPGDIDKIMRDGLGLRWAFLGPFEGVDLNAVGGIREYFERFGFLFNDMAKDLGLAQPVVTPQSIALLESYARSRLPLAQLPERMQWRDRRISQLRAMKQQAGE